MLITVSYHGDLGHPYPASSKSQLVGLCTGLLSCAAVSSAGNIGELLSPAVEAVVVAFRLGLCVRRVRGLVEQNQAAPSSWSALVSGLNQEDGLRLISSFSKQNVGHTFHVHDFQILIL